MKQFKNYIQNKVLVLILLLSMTLLKSQISINYTIKKIPGTRKHILDINIRNNTSDKYFLPLDTTGFRVYYPDEPLSNFYYEFADRGLGLMLMFKENEKYIVGESRSHTFRESDIDDKMSEDIRKKQLTFKNDIKAWQKKYKIKDKLSAEKNMYLFNNLKVLQPGEELSFQKTFDFLTFNDNNGYYNLYFLYPEKKYKLALKYVIEKEIYSNLTMTQKDVYKNYKFFSGDVISNENVFLFSKDELQN